MSPSLRPYQVEVIENTRGLMRAGKRRPLIICPTGGGKTVIAAAIIEAAVRRESRVVFLAHRRELIDQTAEKLLRFGVQPGVILAGRPRALQRAVQVASVQTLVNHPGLLGDVDLVFLDEAHHVTTSNQYAKLLSWWANARVVGLTATPWRLDGQGLADVFDAFTVARTPRELRDEGYLVPVGGWEYSPIDTSHVKIVGGDYQARGLERAAMEAKLFGEIINEWKAHAGGSRTVLFGCTVLHSKAMARAFCEAGVPAEHLDGETPAGERAGILQRIRSGATRVLCNVNVATEGWDCPELECVVLARPTLSTALYLQMVGRVLRPCEGKPMARIHDHARCLSTHGHPYAEREYSPEVGARVSRRQAEQNSERQRRCPSCKSVVSMWPCDACGHLPAPTAEVSTDTAVERRAIGADGRAPKRKKWTEEDREGWWRDSMKTEAARRAFFARMVERHGETKGRQVYYWASGKKEWPPAHWRADEHRAARAVLDEIGGAP